MSARELRVGFMLLMIFGAGAFTGVMLDRKFRSPEPRTDAPRQRPPALKVARDQQVLAEMRTELKLTPEQEERVAATLEAWSGRFRQHRQKSLKERFELFEQMMPVVRTNLVAGQLPAFDEMIDRVRRRQRSMLNHGK